ncbi:trypsin-like peptidase domain-containing protein [Bacteroides helcogenes]|uniref:Protease Do n=1 Tax=Bacteroides helcogenes (strain ATCC 35417 / DSM 20613 / JCM 6297 / CCUG 15421 / P 36-108) TaxID=693979 RepID=E6SPR5_BACT6|nr:trypsin-like peptidase domain-containing protein [Bacteroides helcogenes]ADV43906.1 protease Do [Bacteroides helcogenes P 36-108]MDY5237532.1 trypsin-like peptidase domain-containing protein [Bacteroides helcogenes]
MKQTTKNILGVAAIVLLSSGVAGFTTYKVLRAERPAAFSELFEQNSNARLASYSGVDAQPVDLTQAAENSVHAVVHIRSTQASKVQEVEVRDPFSDFFGDFFGQRGGTQKRQVQTPERRGYGSGVIISKDGYIVTNNHVVDGADEITVKLNDDRELRGRIIGTDPNTDLALIKIEGDDFPTIPVGDSDALKVGEWVLAVGNPFNLNSTVTAGIVSAKARAIGTETPNGQAASIQSFIQTDAAINQGNSGGALVNARGELVGINAMLYSPTGAYSGYGFAIPTSIMKKVIADLKQYGTVQRALLGIKGGTLGTDLRMDEAAAKEMKKKSEELGVKEGVLVAEVVDGGSSAGVLKENDVIVGINSKKIAKFTDLQEALTQYRPGDKINVKIVRNKKEQTVQITLKNEQGNTKVLKDAGMDILGAAFKPVSSDLKKQLNLGYGLEVTGVSDGKMADAGIRKGFIILKANGVQMKAVDDLENVMKAAVKSPDQVLFLTGIFPSGKRGNFAVDLSQE